LPTLTVDDRYLVGPLPGVSGAWVMSGCCVGGLSVSPALGEAVAQWILDGAPALDLSEISTARFAGYLPDETELRERCRQAYATHYRTGADARADSGRGVGEAASTPVPAALANAVFDATGVRLRTVQFRADRVKAALARR
jgi:hypothetical protein